jgi:hypothetical protein
VQKLESSAAALVCWAEIKELMMPLRVLKKLLNQCTAGGDSPAVYRFNNLFKTPSGIVSSLISAHATPRLVAAH